MSVTRRACAKINLALAVGPPIGQGTENAGMHPIASWMHCIDLADTVTIEPADPGVHLSVRWAPDAPRPTPIDWACDKDLCVKAARAIGATTSTPINVQISVTKRIPVGTGLGGGSSDAAATFLAINDLLRLKFSLEQLRELSGSLGSDIAYFLDGPNPPRPAVVSGLGDEIDRLDPHRAGALIQAGTEIILCIPPFSCATGSVYRAFDAFDPKPLRGDDVRVLAQGPCEAGATESWGTCADLFNDLGPAAERVATELGPLRDSIAEVLGTPVHVTGSGSALFALAPPSELSQLQEAFPHVRFVATKLV